MAQALDGLPLALEQAAAYIRRRKIRFADYLPRLATALRMEVSGATDYDRSVAATWFVSESELSPAARCVLRLTSFLAAAPVPRALWVSAAPEVFREALKLIGVSGEKNVNDLCEDGLVQLADSSLVELAAQEYACHRVLAMVQQERLGDDERRAWLDLVVRAVAAVTNVSAADVRNWSLWNVLRPHVEELIVCVESTGVAESVVELIVRLSVLLYGKAEYEAAEPLMRRALAINEASYGSDHPNVATDLNNLAQLLKATNRLGEAEPLMRRARAGFLRESGSDASVDRNGEAQL